MARLSRALQKQNRRPPSRLCHAFIAFGTTSAAAVPEQALLLLRTAMRLLLCAPRRRGQSPASQAREQSEQWSERVFPTAVAGLAVLLIILLSHTCAGSAGWLAGWRSRLHCSSVNLGLVLVPLAWMGCCWSSVSNGEPCASLALASPRNMAGTGVCVYICM